jgi:uncharacterized protein (TIGR02231 family)
MKKLFFAFMLIAGSISAQINHSIKQVTIYPYGAQIERTASVRLEKGNQTLILEEVSPYVDASSIRVSSNNGKIGNVEFSIDYLKKPKVSDRVKSLEDSLDILNVEVKTKENEISALKMELDFIKENKSIKGQQVLDIADIEDFLFYYRKKIPEIQNNILVAEIKNEQLRKLRIKLNQQLNEIRGQQQEQMGVIKVSIQSQQVGNAILECTYNVRNAGWKPNYNIRANGTEGPINIEYNAQVYQRTGVEWDNVPLMLSTGNPSYNSTLPVIRPWYLRQENRIITELKQQTRSLEKSILLEEKRAVPMAAQDENFEPNEQIQLLTFSVFKINAPYKIPSNGQQIQIEVDKYKLDADYQYYAAPKMSDKVFLTAQITGYEELGLLPGPSKIFFENTFVGSAHFDPIQTNDTLDVSLGYDPNVVIKREKVQETSGSSMFGGRKVVNQAFKIELKNGKSTPINLVIEDQIPVSRDQEIKIENLELNGGKLDEAKGIIEWKVDLQGNELKVISFSYKVSYPKKYIVNL